MGGTFNTSSSSGFLIGIGMKIVMMDMLGVVFTLSGVLFDIEATI
jgi:hypothetical protein